MCWEKIKLETEYSLASHTACFCCRSCGSVVRAGPYQCNLCCFWEKGSLSKDLLVKCITVDREMLKIICVKIFHVDKFLQFVWSAKFFFNGWQLHNVWVPGALLLFSLLPRYQESQLSLVVMLWLSGVVIDQTFALGGVDVSVHAYSLTIGA